jgi:cytoskeleton protein RodZ
VNPEAGQNADTGPDTAPSAGALLKAAREKQGLHIAALAAAIKVSPRKLEALEADRHAELPDATFVRALAQTVCRTLKIDPRPVLERLPAAGPHALLPPDGGLNQPFRESAPRVGRSVRGADDSPLSRLAMRPMLWGAGLLLVASVALLFLPLPAWFDRLGARPAAPAEPASAPPLEAPLEAPLPASAPPGTPAPEAAASAASAAAPASAPVAVSETVFSAPAPGAVESTAAPAAPAALLQLRVREASWVEVRDARGGALLSRTVSPGETVGLNGAVPLAVVVGNAEATELVFRGQPVDLASRSRDNVARFQLR